MRSARAFLLVSTVVFAGCDNDVVQIGTGGTGTTSANSTVSNATVTSNSATSTTQGVTTGVTATSAVSTTGSGMPGDCPAACTKVEACGAPAGLCQMYVDCTQPQGACLADCVNDPTIDCMEIFNGFQNQQGPFYDCATQCQGTMTSGTGTMSTGTGVSMQCQQCGQNSCQQAGFQCFQMAGQAECQAWIQCANACTDAACLDDCTAMHPGGQPIQDCLCTSCSMECAGVCN